MINKIRSKIQRMYDRELSGLGLGLFRIAFFGVVFAELCHLIYNKHLIFTYTEKMVRNELYVGFPLYFWMIAVLFIIIGFKTRAALIVNYIFSVIYFGSFGSFEYHVDYTYTGVALLSLFIPLESRLALDSFQNKAKARSIHYFLLVFVGAGLVYFDSVFHKLASPMWLAGLGMWKPATLVQNSFVDLSFLLNHEWLVKTLGYYTLIFELVFIFFQASKRWRIPLLVSGIGLHIGILLAFPIPFFALSVTAIYILLIPDAYLRKVFDRGFLKSVSQAIEKRLPKYSVANLPSPSLGAIKVFIGFCIVAQTLCIAYSPTALNLASSFKKVDALRTFRNDLKPLIQFMTTFAGLHPHGVFMDWHFDRYTSIFALELENKGSRIWLPVVNKDGSPASNTIGRIWVNWTFRIASPVVKKPQRISGFKKYSKFWIHKMGIKLSRDARLIVKRKTVEAPYRWTEGTLTSQKAQPWEDFLDLGNPRDW